MFPQYHPLGIFNLSTQLQKDKILADPECFKDFFKYTEQYGFSASDRLLFGATTQILLTNSVFFFTPLTPPSPIVPTGGHSRLPQSKLPQLLQKFSLTCLICNARAPNPLLYVNIKGLPCDKVKISRASLTALCLKIPPFPC